MDLTKLSDADLQAVASGNLSAVSDEGLQFIAGNAPAAPKAQPASFAKRAAYGMAEPIVGAGQLMARPLGWLGQGVNAAQDAIFGTTGSGDYLAGLAGRNDNAAHDFGATQRAMAPEGVDWARLLGNSITLAPTGFAGKAPSTLLQIAKGGAIAGGVGGATAPVENADNYGGTKTAQTVGGAVAGGLLAPVASKAISAIGSIVQKVGSAISPKMTDAEVRAEIIGALSQNGVNVGQLGKGYLDDLVKQARGALNAGGSLDRPTLANAAAAKTLRIDLTHGQASQDPAQYGKELFLREGPGGEDLARQYVNSLGLLNANLNEIGARLPKPTTDVEAGRKAIGGLLKADEPAKARVGLLYDTARNSLGIDTPLDQRALADGTFQALQDAGVSDKLPAQFVNTLNTLSLGKAPLTVKEAQMMIRAVNGRIGATSDGVERKALQIFKQQLDQTVDNAGTQAGQDTAQAFRAAREAAAKRFQKIEAIPALQDALDGKLAPDDFMRRHIYGAKLDDLKATRAYLRSNDRGSWDQIRSQVLADLRQAATKGSDNPSSFSQAAFNRELQGLKDSGKLGLLFGPDDIAKLETVGKVGRLIQEGPPGVSRTGLSGAAKAMGLLTSIMAKLPGPLGGLAQASSRKGVNVVESTLALKPTLLNPGRGMRPELAGRYGLLAAPLSPYAADQ